MSTIYGMHEQCPPDVLPEGWILHIAEVGHSPEPHPGLVLLEDYENIVRVQHAFDGGGCLPQPGNLSAFVARVRTLVQNTAHCRRWIIGNEPNMPIEWPGEWPLYPDYVASVYDACWYAIHNLPGHEDDEVILPPVAPWNDQIGIGWIPYFQELQAACSTIDAIAIHGYTHGAHPSLITSEAMMGAPYQECHYNFRVYEDWMEAILPEYRHVPVYLTETDQDDAWLNESNTWIQEMYKEIDGWNQEDTQKIHCALLYRWPKHDKYYIEGKQHVIDDFLLAQTHAYSLPEQEEPPMAFRTLYATSFEEEFYDYEGIGELTVPNGWIPVWDPAKTRPEFDAKDKELGHPEVLSGRYAANFFHVFSLYCGALAKTFSAMPGAPIRVSVMCMGVTDGDNGFGMIVQVGDELLSPDAVSPWWSQYMNDYADREWRRLFVETVVPESGQFTVMLRAENNNAGPFSGSHWDDVLVEIDDGSVPPPPPTGGTLIEHLNNIHTALSGTYDFAETGAIKALPM